MGERVQTNTFKPSSRASQRIQTQKTQRAGKAIQIKKNGKAPKSEVAKGGPSKGGRQSRRSNVIMIICVNVVTLVFKKSLQHYHRNSKVLL